MEDNVIDETHKIFTKNQIDKNISIVDDFFSKRRQEYLIEEERKYIPAIITTGVLQIINRFYQIEKTHLFQE